MKNFDIDNVVNVELIQTALILVNDKLCEVQDMDTEKILVRDSCKNRLLISDKDWIPIFLDETWKNQLLGQTSKIKNTRTGVDWIVKRSGRYHYLTISHEISSNENPVIPLHYVHELQEWFYRLTGKNIKYTLSTLPRVLN